MWNPMSEKPTSGRKIIALYNDGSGAVMFFVHDGGFIDQDGEDCAGLKQFDCWAYLPNDKEFWCEIHGEEPLTLSQ